MVRFVGILCALTVMAVAGWAWWQGRAIEPLMVEVRGASPEVGSALETATAEARSGRQVVAFFDLDGAEIVTDYERELKALAAAGGEVFVCANCSEGHDIGHVAQPSDRGTVVATVGADHEAWSLGG